MLFHKKGFVFNNFHMWIYNSKNLYHFSIERRRDKEFLKEALAYCMFPLCIGLLLSFVIGLDIYGSFMCIYSDFKFYLSCACISFSLFAFLKLKLEIFFKKAEDRTQGFFKETTYKDKVNEALSEIKLAVSFVYLFPIFIFSLPCLCELATKAIN